MSEELEWVRNENVFTFVIKGGLNSNLVQGFRKAFLEIEPEDDTIVVDLAGAEHVDSAGLGLMIHMKKKYQDSHIKSIKIINSNAHIRKIFHSMRFEDMFDIDMLDGT